MSTAVKAWKNRNSRANSFHQKQMVNMECPEQALFPPTIGLLPVKKQSLSNSGAMIQMASTRGASTRLIGALNNKLGCLSHLTSSSLLRMDSLLRSPFQVTLRRWPLHTVSSLLATLRRKEWHQVRLIRLHLRYVMHLVAFKQDELTVTDLFQPYAPQPVQQRYPPNGSPMTAYGSPILPGAPPPNWQPGFSPAQYPPRGPTPSGPSAQSGIPYAFGQLPSNINPHDPKSQHPIPGSYNRNHAFNPKTQSFVPGSNGMPPPMQPLQPPFTAPGSHHGSPQIGTPHLAYGGYPSAMPPHPYAVGGYNMARQGSNNSIAAYHTPPPLVGPPHVQHMPPAMQNLQQHIPQPQHIPQNQQVHVPGRANIPQGPNQMFSTSSSHLPAYGNPATLPQKPATGI